jgi:hypothetical protein
MEAIVNVTEDLGMEEMAACIEPSLVNVVIHTFVKIQKPRYSVDCSVEPGLMYWLALIR